MPENSVVFHGPSKEHPSGGNVLKSVQGVKELARHSGVRRYFAVLRETGDHSEEAEHTRLLGMRTSFGQLSQWPDSPDPWYLKTLDIAYGRAANGM
jgi:hypothetical protein